MSLKMLKHDSSKKIIQKIDTIVSNAASNISRTAKFFKKRATSKDEVHSDDIETFEEKTKRLLTEDPYEWNRFQKELRQNGIVTNFAVEIVFYHYIKIRAAEEDIDRCVNKYYESQVSFKSSMKNFENREFDSRARAA